MIRARGIEKSYRLTDGPSLKVLEAVNLHVRAGEFVAMVGPSGCGKTSLLKILAGLADQDAGSLTVAGETAGSARRQGLLGYMSQADTLLPWRSVLGNVELGLELMGRPARDRKETALGLIARVGLQGFENSYPSQLSGGMKKRLALMRTLAYDPQILYMDEPFGALDVQTRDMLAGDLLALWDETKKTVVFVTHDLAEAICLADRVLLMTARPTAVKSAYPIDLPRPRTAEIRLTRRFGRILKELWNDLSSEVKKWPAQMPRQPEPQTGPC